MDSSASIQILTIALGCIVLFAGRNVFSKWIHKRAKFMYFIIDTPLNLSSPDNLLIIGAGVLAGTIIPGANRTNITFKSPLTGLLGHSCLGGDFGPELKFAGYDTSIIEARTRPILNAMMELFPGIGDPEKAEPWAGLRPKTPDSVPLLGRTPYPNLYLNTGHGTLGWTMAAGSARILSDIIGGLEPAIPLDGLGLARFGW